MNDDALTYEKLVRVFESITLPPWTKYLDKYTLRESEYCPLQSAYVFLETILINPISLRQIEREAAREDWGPFLITRRELTAMLAYVGLEAK